MDMSKGSTMKRRCRTVDGSATYSDSPPQDCRLHWLAKVGARNHGQGEEDTDAEAMASIPVGRHCMAQDSAGRTGRATQLGGVVPFLRLAEDHYGVAESLGPRLLQDRTTGMVSKAHFQ